MKLITDLEKKLRGEMSSRINDNDIIEILEVLQCAEEEIERLKEIIENNNLPLNPCDDCGKEERNPGLSVCGPCYHERITGNNNS